MPTRNAADMIRSSPMFSRLSDGELRALAAVAREERIAARQFVFMEGEPSLWFCVVVSGRVKILRESRDGKEVVLELLGAGEPFGGVAVIERRPYPASAQATEPSVILKIPQESIVPVAERNPSLVREMALMIGRRLRAAHDTVKSLAVDPVEARLAAAVLRLAEREGLRQGKHLVLGFRVTRQMLADMTGTTVETTIRILRRWTKDGITSDDRARLVIRDVEALRALAADEPDP
jgi:CRP/FNR family transcriptional regulator, nitrogen oxide reductase regulator